tara:strand:- start:96 stop:362 length:267 start_codon:yes stop_codon:yes gene_type:complete
MPRYSYKCDACGNILDTSHSMGDKKEVCSEISDCKKDQPINKLFTGFHTKKETAETKKEAGEVVKESIREYKNNIDELRKSFRERFED